MLFELHGLPSVGKSSVARLVHLRLGKARIDARRVYPVSFAYTARRHPIIACKGALHDLATRRAIADRRLRRQLLGWWLSTQMLRRAEVAPNTLLEEGMTKRLWGALMAMDTSKVSARRLRRWVVEGTVIVSLEANPSDLVARSRTRPRQREAHSKMALADGEWWSRAMSANESVIDLVGGVCPVERVDASRDLHSVGADVTEVIMRHLTMTRR